MATIYLFIYLLLLLLLLLLSLLLLLLLLQIYNNGKHLSKTLYTCQSQYALKIVTR